MAEPFRVDPEALNDARRQLAELHRHTERTLSEIDSLVTNLRTPWSGRGAAARADAHRHWTGGEAMLRESLARLQSADASARP
jgi:uncharacterized protein YukE